MFSFFDLIDLMLAFLMLASSLFAIYATLYNLNWANKNQLLKNSVFLWIGWVVSAIVSSIFFSYLNILGSAELPTLILFVCLMNIFPNIYLLSFLQKESDYESFMTEKKEKKLPEKVIWKTAIALAIITNTVAFLVFILVAYVAKLFPRSGIDFAIYN